MLAMDRLMKLAPDRRRERLNIRPINPAATAARTKPMIRKPTGRRVTGKAVVATSNGLIGALVIAFVGVEDAAASSVTGV